jgi:3-hydroxyisobutyrate dehydrogenase-like beta-hydroxyacid dehydrogenase
MMTVGYIGLGAMGSALAGRLPAYHDLRVWDLNQSAIDKLVAKGAKAVASAAELAHQCEVIVLLPPSYSRCPG